MSTTLTVTADDFGLAPEVNEAVERAHREGILTAASLMVAEPHAADAVARARTMPGLGIGLHLTLVEGSAVLPRAAIPDLIGADGRLRTDLASYGATIFFRPSVRRQVAAEIEAQFRAFAATGLPLHHVDAHKHFHLHPTIAGLLLEIGPRFGMRRLRVPVPRQSKQIGRPWPAVKCVGAVYRPVPMHLPQVSVIRSEPLRPGKGST